MRSLAAIALLIAFPLAPTVAAEGCTVLPDGTRVCTFEVNESNGSCASGSEFHASYAAVSTQGMHASVTGWSSCYGAPNHSHSSTFFQVRVVNGAGAPMVVQQSSWELTSFGSPSEHCEWMIDVGVYSTTADCVVGPLPNPGWGQLLP